MVDKKVERHFQKELSSGTPKLNAVLGGKHTQGGSRTKLVVRDHHVGLPDLKSWQSLCTTLVQLVNSPIRFTCNTVIRAPMGRPQKVPRIDPICPGPLVAPQPVFLPSNMSSGAPVSLFPPNKTSFAGISPVAAPVLPNNHTAPRAHMFHSTNILPRPGAIAQRTGPIPIMVRLNPVTLHDNS